MIARAHMACWLEYPVYGVYVCPSYQESSCCFRMSLFSSPMQGCSSLLQVRDEELNQAGLRMLCVRQIVNCKMKEKVNLTIRCLNVAIIYYSVWILTNCSAGSSNPSKIFSPFRKQGCMIVNWSVSNTQKDTYVLKSRFSWDLSEISDANQTMASVKGLGLREQDHTILRRILTPWRAECRVIVVQ